MSTLVHCRLEAGPFDGDEGHIDAPVPDAIWAHPCLDGTAQCPTGGVHWVDDAVHAAHVSALGVSVELYRYSRVEAGTFRYEWAGLATSLSRAARTEVPA